MKKFAILVLFFATGAAIGMERMNTEYGTNHKLTKNQYNRVIDRWEDVYTKQENAEALLRKTTNEYDKKFLENKIEKLKEKSNALDKVVHGDQAYTDPELSQLMY